jgi:hypothetical protein
VGVAKRALGARNAQNIRADGLHAQLQSIVCGQLDGIFVNAVINELHGKTSVLFYLLYHAPYALSIAIFAFFALRS